MSSLLRWMPGIAMSRRRTMLCSRRGCDRFKAWIEDHLTDPDLSLEKIAKNNGISLRHLHYLFRLTEMSASEWVWDRRLERCYDVLTRPELNNLSVTEVAYQLGFNSSSHFSTTFRRKFGIRPSDVRRR